MLRNVQDISWKENPNIGIDSEENTSGQRVFPVGLMLKASDSAMGELPLELVESLVHLNTDTQRYHVHLYEKPKGMTKCW